MNKTGNCSQCGGLSNLKTGIKDGREWAGYFCTANKKHVDWVDTRNSGIPKPFRAAELKKEPDWDKIRSANEENMAYLNAKNVAGNLLAAAMRKGELTLVDALAKYEETTQFIYDIGKK